MGGGVGNYMLLKEKIACLIVIAVSVSDMTKTKQNQQMGNSLQTCHCV